MKFKIGIEYCTSWGYLDKAVSLAEDLLAKYKNNISSVELIPSSGGVFEISLNFKNIYSKKELNRYPNDGEIIELIEDNLS